MLAIPPTREEYVLESKSAAIEVHLGKDLRQSRQDSLVSDVAMSPQCAITLVHGTIPRIGPITFFRKQQWMESRSVFCEQIAAHLDVIWLPFAWSGINSHLARIDAGKQLANVLCHNFSLYPSIPHYVICHSHGGNVALYALKRLSLKEHEKIAGVVTLGTPFIWSSKRDVATVRETLMTCVKYGSAAWFIAYLLICFGVGFSFISLLPLAVAGLGVMLWQFLSKYPIVTWERSSDQFDLLLDARVPPVALLCVAVNRDEAKLWVRWWELIGRTLFGHWHMSIIEWTLDLLAALRFSVLGPHSVIFAGVFAGLGMLVPPIMFCGSALTISSPWGYGEPWFLRWIISVTTKEIPHTKAAKMAWIFKSRLTALGIYSNDDDCFDVQRFKAKRWQFNHSWLHDDIDVAASIACWVLSQMREGHPGLTL